MNSENLKPPALLHMYVSPRSVYAGGVVMESLSDDILIVKETLLSRVALIALAATIGTLSVTFLYWFLQPLSNEQNRFDIEKWLVVGVASAGVLFSLALTLKKLFVRPIRLDRSRGELSYNGWLFGSWEHRLSDLIAIQICYGKSEVHHPDSGRRRVTLQYQVNLVFHNSGLVRRNISQQKYCNTIKRVARQLADFLDVPLVNYVGPAGTMDAGDAKIRRLLVES